MPRSRRTDEYAIDDRVEILDRGWIPARVVAVDDDGLAVQVGRLVKGEPVVHVVPWAFVEEIVRPVVA